MKYEQPIMDVTLFDKKNIVHTSLTGEQGGDAPGTGGPWE